MLWDLIVGTLSLSCMSVAHSVAERSNHSCKVNIFNTENVTCGGLSCQLATDILVLINKERTHTRLHLAPPYSIHFSMCRSLWVPQRCCSLFDPMCCWIARQLCEETSRWLNLHAVKSLLKIYSNPVVNQKVECCIDIPNLCEKFCVTRGRHCSKDSLFH